MNTGRKSILQGYQPSKSSRSLPKRTGPVCTTFRPPSTAVASLQEQDEMMSESGHAACISRCMSTPFCMRTKVVVDLRSGASSFDVLVTSGSALRYDSFQQYPEGSTWDILLGHTDNEPVVAIRSLSGGCAYYVAHFHETNRSGHQGHELTPMRLPVACTKTIGHDFEPML